MFWVISNFRPISGQETLNFSTTRPRALQILYTQIFDVILDGEKDGKKKF